MDDPRFTKLFTDPKFRDVPKKEKKVKIDQRFQSLFKDKKFVSKVSVDKRGRPGNYSTKENYEKFYQMDSDSDDEEDEEDTKTKTETKKKSQKPTKTSSESSKAPSNLDYARGEAVLTDSSSGEDSSDEEGESAKAEVEEETFDKWGELDHDADTTDIATSRLAVCKMDWDRVGADDLFLALSSFCPPGGRLIKVSIYPSEFGKSRMAEEDQYGPKELQGHSKKAQNFDDSDGDSEPENDEAKSLRDMERVRQYQVKRLDYYYAIAEFNSDVAAECVYNKCDKNEYEMSATAFDLRFIPEDMEFNDDPPKEVCDKAPDMDTYKPKLFSTTALSLGKVDLTWDETDPQRLAAMKKAFDNVDNDENDDLVKQFIASSSDDEIDEPDEVDKKYKKGDKTKNKKAKKDAEESEDEVKFDEPDFSEEDDEKVIAKYKALLTGAEDQTFKDDVNEDSEASDGAMEMTYVPEAEKNTAAEEKALEDMTPWEKYLNKKKEKNKKKKEKKQSLKESDEVNEENEEDNEEVPSDVDLNDPFFKEELSSLKSTKKDDKISKGKKRGKDQETDGNQPKDLELLTMDSDDDRQHFDYKDIVEHETKSKKRRMKRKKNEKTPEDNFQMDLQDERFSGIFNNPKYNVDPSHPGFKKTKSMASIIEEKQKRIIAGDKQQINESEVRPKSDKKQSSALESLANSVKSKSDKLKRKKF